MKRVSYKGHAIELASHRLRSGGWVARATVILHEANSVKKVPVFGRRLCPGAGAVVGGGENLGRKRPRIATGGRREATGPLAPTRRSVAQGSMCDREERTSVKLRLRAGADSRDIRIFTIRPRLGRRLFFPALEAAERLFLLPGLARHLFLAFFKCLACHTQYSSIYSG